VTTGPPVTVVLNGGPPGTGAGAGVDIIGPVTVGGTSIGRAADPDIWSRIGWSTTGTVRLETFCAV
jgi:hypothetical protein